MKSDRDNIYPYSDLNGYDHPTQEDMEASNKRILASQNQVAEAGIPQKVDPELAAYERMMSLGYQAAGPEPQVAEAGIPQKVAPYEGMMSLGYQAAEHNHRM